MHNSQATPLLESRGLRWSVGRRLKPSIGDKTSGQVQHQSIAPGRKVDAGTVVVLDVFE